MKSETLMKLEIVTLWLFFVSIIWFTIGLVIVGTYHWPVLLAVPFLGLMASGIFLDLNRRKVIP